ncbi:hypothetical protein ABIC83_002884 [Roseateles asaccharophilus]|uniref:hypothetical protein n=1 Tax=Roseateles asaccharophilus TaxID=582607 RepID=UPI0038360DDC
MQMSAKYPSKCAATGKQINRGDIIDFDRETRRVVLVESVPQQPKARSVRRYERTDYYIAKYGSGAPA